MKEIINTSYSPIVAETRMNSYVCFCIFYYVDALLINLFLFSLFPFHIILYKVGFVGLNVIN